MLLFGCGQIAAQVKKEDPPAQGKDQVKFIGVNTANLESFAYDAGHVKFIASSEDTNGAFSVVELTELPGYKTFWHRHNHTEETFYILEGVLTVKVGEKVTEYGPGSYVLIPRATPHGQGNFGKVPVRFIVTFTPGGYERRFRERIEISKTAKSDADFQKKLIESRGHVDGEALGTWDFKP
jgi:mannose-6-phosphate isomerase-like protein (cupin superfamily)